MWINVCSSECEPERATEHFGFHVGDMVGWIFDDADIPLGCRGVIKGFTEVWAIVRFGTGEFRENPTAPYLVGVEVTGFRLADSVEWVGHDNGVPLGQVGVVVGPRGDCNDKRQVHVRFSGREWSFDLGQLRKVSESSIITGTGR